ncbi:hypothetical protein [Streptomyces odonnellii]|uniref:hypothetical protein n=1 Tax=Streptomyces odonnellii TaxID=1417980 RepID=UPI000625D688|nr:hypothetical protein [Streptomyces odonnellii]
MTTTAIELAAVASIAADAEPETWLQINFHKPCGGVTIRYAWTNGGADLGDRIDLLALAAPLDAADWIHITSEHVQTSHRGRIEIQAHPLRPILADVQAGVRCPTDRNEFLLRVIDLAATETGQTPRPGMPRWIGVGPTLLARRTP